MTRATDRAKETLDAESTAEWLLQHALDDSSAGFNPSLAKCVWPLDPTLMGPPVTNSTNSLTTSSLIPAKVLGFPGRGLPGERREVQARQSLGDEHAATNDVPWRDLKRRSDPSTFALSGYNYFFAPTCDLHPCGSNSAPH